MYVSVGLFFASTVFGANHQESQEGYSGETIAIIPVQSMERPVASEQEIEAVRDELWRRAKLRCGCAVVHGVGAAVPAVVAASLKASPWIILGVGCPGAIPGLFGVGQLWGVACLYCNNARFLGVWRPVDAERLQRTLDDEKRFERELWPKCPGYGCWFRCYTCGDEGCSRAR